MPNQWPKRYKTCIFEPRKRFATRRYATWLYLSNFIFLQEIHFLNFKNLKICQNFNFFENFFFASSLKYDEEYNTKNRFVQKSFILFCRRTLFVRDLEAPLLLLVHLDERDDDDAAMFPFSATYTRPALGTFPTWLL